MIKYTAKANIHNYEIQFRTSNKTDYLDVLERIQRLVEIDNWLNSLNDDMNTQHTKLNECTKLNESTKYHSSFSNAEDSTFRLFSYHQYHLDADAVLDYLYDQRDGRLSMRDLIYISDCNLGDMIETDEGIKIVGYLRTNDNMTMIQLMTREEYLHLLDSNDSDSHVSVDHNECVYVHSLTVVKRVGNVSSDKLEAFK
nr:MAG TPA: hypothetical protein [Caudoviricetes sp.]